jgi:hypothetical protein
LNVNNNKSIKNSLHASTAFALGNSGIPYVHSFDSGQPGPHVMVNCLTHGNELCGLKAITVLLDHGIKPRAGRLTLSFANVAAYARYDVDNPQASRFGDLSHYTFESCKRSCSAPILGTLRDLARYHSGPKRALGSIVGRLNAGIFQKPQQITALVMFANLLEQSLIVRVAQGTLLQMIVYLLLQPLALASKWRHLNGLR